MSGVMFSESFIIERAIQSINVNYVNLAAVTCLGYDTLLSLDDEITYVWRTQWSFVKILYIASKYLAYLDAVAFLIFFFNSNMTPSACLTLYSATSYVIVAGILIAEIILLMRTCALWGLSRYVLWYLVAFDFGAVALVVVELTKSLHVNKFQFVESPIPSIRRCFPIFSDSAVNTYVNYLCLIAVELNILLLTLWRGVLHWRRSGNQLIYIFYRDGVAYLVSLAAFSAVNVVFFKYFNTGFYWSIMLEPQRIAHAILASHLVLNIRKFRHNNGAGHSLSGDVYASAAPVSFHMKPTMSATTASTCTSASRDREDL
ncbi:hypothetical protein SCHPADRAFT_193856 [Schizopora paradoxa]|uniref:DUF6533 domain-containing protein n=1 Tax=Schizopora paradoxa TaxID=27342 RepID=A0A0H2RYJ7_9AGAM|nr:hypothetical protein SCHPADRAFT_193856 [Schizopora paradoxa]